MSMRSLHLQRAVALEPKWAEHARGDNDFASIRGEQGFPAGARGSGTAITG